MRDGVALLACRQATASALRVARPVIRNPSLQWVFHYADVRPLTATSPESIGFLLTNAGFVVSGASLATIGGDPVLGSIVELASLASVGYHWSQCALGGSSRPVVQLAMLIDYALAIPSLFLGLAYAASLPAASLPESALLFGGLAFLGLVAGWVFESPRAYMALHGAWHVFAALAACELSNAHSQAYGIVGN